jgi:voltage-gated potassium channel
LRNLSIHTRITLIFSFIAIVITIGTVGYILIEKFDFLHALYMTVITIFTVGYAEVGGNLSEPGIIFTIVLIILSWISLALAVSIITTSFISGELLHYFHGRKSKTMIKKMKEHVIVCGFGRNGKQTIRELIAHKRSYVVIDMNKEIMIENPKITNNYVVGDAREDAVLIEAGIDKASAIIVTFPNDADNLFVVITARALNKSIKIISRGSNESTEKKLLSAGANNVVMPEQAGGTNMALLVATPDVVDFLHHLSIHGHDHPNLEEIECKNPQFNLNQKTIGELGIRSKSGANIVGFKTVKGEYIINPSADTILHQGSKIFVLGNENQIQQMKNIFKDKK